MKKKQIIFHSLFCLMALMIFAYGLLEFRKDIWSILGLGVVVPISAFMLLDILLEERKRKIANDIKLTQSVEELIVIEKASFVAIKKCDKNIADQLEYIENKIK